MTGQQCRVKIPAESAGTASRAGGGAAGPVKVLRRPKSNGQAIRFWAQAAFAALCIWIGVEFTIWHNAHSAGQIPVVQRPPGVEGFLPISALMSAWYWIQTGVFHRAHPAGMVILIAIVGVSLLFKKSFCGWFCPVGTLSESVGEFGRKLFKRNFVLRKWADLPLRSLKYLMLAFLVYVVFFAMDAASIGTFLDSPYNRVADVKMFLFFKEISRTSIIVIASLTALSMLVKNFWCRYFCPYGALLGIVGLFSPFRVVRNASSCIDCAKCAKVCPASIKVDKLRSVMSDECTSCMACVDACPVAGALEYKAARSSRFNLRPAWLAAAAAALFIAITGFAMLTGNWRGDIPESEYSRRIQDIRNPVYQHNYGGAPAETPDHGALSGQ